jgi:hypothetical protein
VHLYRGIFEHLCLQSFQVLYGPYSVCMIARNIFAGEYLFLQYFVLVYIYNLGSVGIEIVLCCSV